MGNTQCQVLLYLKKTLINYSKLFNCLALTLIFTLSGCTIPSAQDDIKNRMLNARMDMQTYNSMRPELIAGIDLNKAISLGLTYNLELWLSRQELAIQKELKNSSIAQMLPELTANINNGLRDSHSASNSIGLFSGQEAQNVTYSYSDMKSHTYGGVNLLWNVLDFGVSYYRLKQQHNRTIHALHEIRRIRQKLAYDIAQAYWRCVTLELVVNRGKSLKAELTAEINAIEESQVRGRLAESAAIERRYPLKTQLIKLADYSAMYQSARLRLAQLMGLPIGAEFSLSYRIDEDFPVNLNLDNLETTALNRRPELFQEDLQEAITHDEAKATILGMLPSPQMFINPSADDNKFLYYNSWLSAGLNVSWNLLDIPNKIFKTRSEYQRIDFIRKKRLALAVAIITQLRIAAIEYDFAVNRYRNLKDLAQDSEQIISNTEKAAKAGKGKKSMVIMKKLAALRDYAATMDAYNQVMIARAKVQNSIGADPVADGSLSTDIPVREDTAAPENKNTVYITDTTLPVITAKDTPAVTPNTSNISQQPEVYFVKEEPIILNQYSPEPRKYF